MTSTPEESRAGKTGAGPGGLDLSAAQPVAAREDEGNTFHVRDENDELLFHRPPGSDPKAEPLPVTITMAGTYSQKYRKARAAQMTKTLKRGRSGVVKLTGELLEEQRDDLVATCALAWDGFYSGVRPVPCQKQHVLEHMQAMPWIRDQAEEAMNDHEGFTRTSSSS